METLNYLNNGHGLAVVAVDERPQAHRAAVPGRRSRCSSSSAASSPCSIRLELLTPAGDLLDGGDLQQDVHHARRGDGLLLPDPVDPRDARQLPDPDHDRREGPGVPADQPAELVHLRARRRSSRSSRRCSGGVDTGWTFYTPYSTAAANGHVITAALGVFITGFSSILTGLNFIVTIHRMRAPGLTWFRLPLFVWAHYATSLIMILGTPVIAITRAAGRGRARRCTSASSIRRSAATRALPAPVLVLLAPGRLHHDPAGDGRDQRDRRRRSRARTSSATRSSRSPRSPSRSSASSCGATTCSSPASRSTRAWSSRS